MRKTIYIWFLIFIIPNILGLSFDEFAESYDYNLNFSFLNITDIKINDCNFSCDNLNITLDISGKPGEYDFYGIYQTKTYYTRDYIFGENDKINLIFYPPFEKDTDKVFLKIVNDNKLVYFNNITEINISNIQFISYNISVNDVYILNDSINFNVSFDYITDKSLEITGYLQSKSNVYISNINVNDAYFILSFKPYQDSNYTLKHIEIDKNLIPVDYFAGEYNLSIINILNESLDDRNLNIFIESAKSNLTFLLFDDFSNFIVNGSLMNDFVLFDGCKINESQLNGPYIMKVLTTNNTYEYTTNYYSYQEFGRNLVQEDKAVSIIKKLKDKKNSIMNSIAGFFEDVTTNNDTSNNDITNDNDTKTADYDYNDNGFLNNTNDKTGQINNKTTNQLTGNAINVFDNNLKPNIFISLSAIILIGLLIFGFLKYMNLESK